MKTLHTPALSTDGQAYLLNLVMTRRTAELAVFALPLLLMSLHARDAAQPLALAPWVVAMALVAPFLWWMRSRYKTDRIHMDAAELNARWRPRLTLGAFVYGLFWVAPLTGWLDAPPLAFSVLFYMVLTGITAGAAIYLSAVFSAFVGLMLGIWLVASAAVPRMFPDHGNILQAVLLLFCLVVVQHAVATHRFLRRQIRLEEFNQQLTDQYRIARNQAESALSEKNHFLRVASHDLRQPLQAMTMLVAALGLRNKDTTLLPLLNDLKRSMDGMGLMFNALLDLSRQAAAQPPSLREPIALGSLLAEVASLYRAQAQARQLAIRVHPVPPQARALADPVLMRQALGNLVHNALRYTTRGGLLLGVRQRGTDWQIEVWDTGMGIAAADGHRIFTADYRPQAAQRMDGSGQGLGLAVVARCAELMGAQYGFTSRIGQGSRFWLRVAASRQDDAAIAPVAALGHDHGGPGTLPRLRGQCLILEDNADVSAAWAALLDSWGVDTRFATSGPEAQAHLDCGFTPNAILCDQRLPTGESGFDVLRALMARCPSAGGAMVSGEHASSALVEAESEGYLVLHKPLAPETLHALLTTWFDTAQGVAPPWAVQH